MKRKKKKNSMKFKFKFSYRFSSQINFPSIKEVVYIKKKERKFIYKINGKDYYQSSKVLEL